MSKESKRFDHAVRKILSVSREELKRREEEWKRQHRERKAGRKAKSREPVQSSRGIPAAVSSSGERSLP